MADTQIHTCSDCAVLSCKAKDEAHYPAFCLTAKQNQARLEEALKIYQEDPEQGNIARVSAGIEGEFYGRLTRVEETIEFIRRMGYQKIGIASCVGLMPETRIFTKILKALGIEYYTVGCKLGAVDKTVIGIPNEKKLNGGCGHESMCNPILQAKELDRLQHRHRPVRGPRHPLPAPFPRPHDGDDRERPGPGPQPRCRPVHSQRHVLPL